MRTALLLVVPLAAGCPFTHDGFFIDDVAFDTAGLAACSTLAAPAWPDRNALDVSVFVAPEARFSATMAQMAGVTVTLTDRDGAETPGVVELTESSSGVLVGFVPTEPLTPSWDYQLVALAPNLSDGSGCEASTHVGFRTGAAHAQPASTPLGSWWLSGDDRTNAAAAILGRLFPLIGDGYGLAPRITIEGGPVLALGTVQRSFGLPDNPGDGVDRLVARWGEDGLHVVDGVWEIDDPAGAVLVTGLEVDARLATDGRSLADVRLRGHFDLRAWSPEALGAACDLADTYGLPCQACDGAGEVACLDLDARAMAGAAWTPPAAR